LKSPQQANSIITILHDEKPIISRNHHRSGPPWVSCRNAGKEYRKARDEAHEYYGAEGKPFFVTSTIVLLDSFDDLERMGLDQKNLLSNLHNNILREPRKKQTPIKL
jgi:hypothetical protein